VAGLLEGVPGAATLDAAGLEELLGRYDRRRAAESRRETARARRSEIMRRIEKAGEAQDRPGRDLHRLVADAGRRLTGLEDQRRELVDEQDGPGDDTPLSARAVEQRLDATRAEIEELRHERDRLRIALDRTTRAVGDLVRLEERAEELERRRAEIESTVAALRTAHALLRDGYDEFRDQDEDRLVAAVSGHLEALGEPPLGPFRTESGLEAPTVGLSRRRLPFDSPELSHGQRHLVMLAVRLGAADFLSLDAPAAPLIVDEPFAHLDDRHAAQVWNLLRDIAVHRQVIITTQEEDLLGRLGVAATIRLAGDEVAATTGGSAGHG
jgi:DNA repair exonuclease SbcCD ATPase subunit